MSENARTSPAGPTCLLLVGDRVVLRATTPPDSEYALFEIGEIELRASEPGRVREHGYQTTVEHARTRLTNMGMTGALAREFALAMQPVISDAYARGLAVRRVARYLGPLELFQSEGYDGAAHAYRGVFLDLATLAQDLGLEHSGATLHALYLATILETEDPSTTVLLSTDACTKGGKPGARTYKRPTFTDPKRLLNALGGLAHRAPHPQIREVLPRADVIAFLRARADTATDDGARDLYKSLEGTVALRDTPEKGPLAEPDLWAIETRLESGDFADVPALLEAAERRHGRTPGTTYLRARTSLLLQLEPAAAIAERVSALALSLSSFRELSLLAAEAWLDAGEQRRAMPFARDLVDATGVDEGLLMRAQRLLARAVGAAPQKKSATIEPDLASSRISAAPVLPSAPPPSIPPFPSVPPFAAAAPFPSAPPPSPFGSTPPFPPVSSFGSAPPFRAASAPPPSLPPLPPQRAPMMLLGEFSAESLLPRAAEAELDEIALQPEDLIAVLEPPPPARSPLPPPVAPPPPKLSRAAPPLPSNRPSRPAPPLPSSRRIPTAMPTAMPMIDLVPDLGALPPMPSFAERDTSQDFPTPIPMAMPLPTATEPGPFVGNEIELPLTPPDIADFPSLDPAASFTLELPGPEVLPAPAPEPRPSRRPRLSGVMMETRPPSSFDPRAEPDTPDEPRRTPAPGAFPRTVERTGPAPARRSIEPRPLAHDELDFSSERLAHERPTPLRPPQVDARSAAPTPVLDAGDAITLGETATTSWMHGASLPPYQLETPPPMLPKAPLLPKLGGATDELAEHLALPPGFGAEARSLVVLPTSVLEARVQFTMLARELGLDYRLKRGLDLRADVSGIEAMQAVLLESFPEHLVRSPDEGYELRRHGALLSEILARRLDAEWLDISPRELGYWVMIVPPDTRVWPFGRVARLVAMGHKERDLVSYFFELQARSRR